MAAQAPSSVSCAIAIVGLSACGGSTGTSTDGGTPASDRAQVVAAIQAMENAINGADARRLCEDIYAFQGSTTVAECVGTMGPALAKTHAKVRITVVSAKLNGRRATVVTETKGLARSKGAARETFSLVKEGSSWRVLFE